VLQQSGNDVVNLFSWDTFRLMSEFAFENNFEFPYLYDETQDVAKGMMLLAHLISFYLITKISLSRQLDDNEPGTAEFH
jgi:hypothetical protein